MLRVVFFGTPDFAVRSLDALIASRHMVVGVVTQPDRPSGRGQRVLPSPVKRRAEIAGIPVWQPDRLRNPEWLSAMQSLKADVGVVAAYGKILPQVLLDIPRLGLVNVHASLLPAYRGAAPIERALLDGRHETGVTIMRVVKELDAGPTFAATPTPIDLDETSERLEARLAGLGADLLLKVLDDLDAGTAREHPQDDSRATYAPRIVRQDGLVEWNRHAIAIHNQVRALHPWPHAFTFLGDVRLILHETRPFDSASAAQIDPPADSPDAVPGTIVTARRGRLLVAAAHGTVVEILRLQEEGRRVLAAREFRAGRHLDQGTRFTAPSIP